MTRLRDTQGRFVLMNEPLMPLVWERIDMSLHATPKAKRCSGCGGLRDRGTDQRYCSACHAEAQRKYRLKLAALIEAGKAVRVA